MKKYMAAFFVFLLLFPLASCANVVSAVGETKTYAIGSEIHSLDIQINAADLIIEHGDRFSVESNLKDLSVSQQDGVLTIVEGQTFGVHYTDYTDAALKLCVPDNAVLKAVSITTGAAKLTAGTLSANSVELKLGAGNVHFGCLNAYSDAEIKGGAGQISVARGTLNDLTLEMGVGTLDLRVALLGDCDLEFGVGESNLTLIGSKEDYKVEAEKGIGSISIDGKNISAFDSSASGENTVKIKGGVGVVNIIFEAEQPLSA